VPFFQSFLDDTVDQQGSKIFDWVCQHIMKEYAKFGEQAMRKRTNNNADSFEYKLFHYLMSPDFAKICQSLLPTKAMQTALSAWPILGHVLGKIFTMWLTNAMHNERKKSPKLVERKFSVICPNQS